MSKTTTSLDNTSVASIARGPPCKVQVSAPGKTNSEMFNSKQIQLQKTT